MRRIELQLERAGRRAVRPMLGGLILLLASGMIGCGAPKPPAPIELAPGRPSPTGLRLVLQDEHGIVLVRPGVEMAEYTGLIVDPFMLTYASGVDPGDEPVRTLDREDEERFKQVVRDAFFREMRRSDGFELTDRPGPSTLRVQGWLYDLALDEPPTDDARNFPLCFGRVVVLLTIRHSETAQSIAEIGDRTELTCPVQSGGYATTTWSAIGRGVGGWAVRLRGWLERLRALPPVEE